MNYEDLKDIISIPLEEKEAFKKFIRLERSKLISQPYKIVESVFKENNDLLSSVVSNCNISETIFLLREQSYKKFLIEESEFNVTILKSLGKTLETPKKIIDLIIDENFDLSQEKSQMVEEIKNICGEYAGRISPYIYELCLSNTQSRRSRAGKTFEAIIYKLYDVFGYSYASQKKIGKSAFADHGLGKMVDSLLPSLECFEQRRDKTIIGTMKTTLRERWQEVIEELQSTGLPSIHLLTMDDHLSEEKALKMSKHNVIIVVPEYVKKQKNLTAMRNIISFETYFLEEIPSMINYWK